MKFALNIKKTKLQPVAGFPLQTMAMDLKEWFHDKKSVVFFHMIEHATRYSVPCVVTSKKKELIVKKILQYWIRIFGHPIKILVDNRETRGGIRQC